MPAGHLPVTSYLAVPVISRTGETLGGLFFGHEDAGVFTERTEQLIAGLVSQAAVAIDNAQLYQEAQQLNATLEQRVLERTAELQASEQTFRELVNILPIAVYVCEPSGLIESYNRRAVELWGREPKLHDSADRYCGSHQLYTLDGVPLPHPDCFMAQVLHTGIAISNQEIIVERPDGVRRMGIVNIIPRRDDRGNLTGAINCLLDVTDLKEIEEELRKSQAMFQGLFESAPDAIILVNDQGEIVRLNRQAEELFGYDRTALETKPIEELLPSRFHKNHLTHRASYHNNPRPRQMGFGLELYGQHRDGTEIPVDVTLSPHKGEGETLTISIIRDITEKKRLEDELTDVQRRLFESSERERLRIAQELHDGPIQELYGVYYRMGDLESAMVNEASIAKLTSAAVLVQQVTQNLRSLCMELRPPTLAAFGLEKAIRSHTEYFQTAHPGLIMDLDLMPDGQELPERTRLALFRIYQEGLNNIARHAEADHIWVRLNLDDNNVTLEIRDNGQGFTVPRHWVHMARDGHLGVIGMSERAQSIRGYLDIKSAQGEGTFLKVVVPRHNGHESED
jgi:PAS domain S-box-containing protein